MIRLDCRSEVRPGLAQSWTGDSAGATWTFELHDSAVSAGEIAARWRSRGILTEAGVDSAIPLDDRRLAVIMRTRSQSVPELFADSSLAIPVDWPWDSIAIVRVAPRDLRDALDGPADLVLTDDPAVLDYARTRPDLATRPLPWSRTYVLLRPREGKDLGRVTDSTSFRGALARDAVRADARGATPPFWWADSSGCAAVATTVASAPAPVDRTITFPRGDRIARGLAERLVALARPGLTTRGLDPAAFAQALRAGTAAGFVLPLPRRALVPCRERATWPADAEILPLIDTRMTAVVRQGAPALEIQWDGTLRLSEPPGRP